MQNKDDQPPIDFGKIIKLNPKLGVACIGIAKVYAKKGDKAKAVENYNLAKRYDLKYAKIADAEIRTLFNQ
ncbi:MAG: hypothetical protein LE178_06495 [Endomicrobium sp.]|nr:hypothetical protein [Endomicrobium sp.]